MTGAKFHWTDWPHSAMNACRDGRAQILHESGLDHHFSTNHIVNVTLRPWLDGACSMTDALVSCLRALAEQNKVLLETLVGRQMRTPLDLPSTVPISHNRRHDADLPNLQQAPLQAQAPASRSRDAAAGQDEGRHG